MTHKLFAQTEISTKKKTFKAGELVAVIESEVSPDALHRMMSTAQVGPEAPKEEPKETKPSEPGAGATPPVKKS